MRGIHRSPVNSPHKGQWRGAIIFSLICAWMNHWVNNREAGDMRCHRAHYNVTIMGHRGHRYIYKALEVIIKFHFISKMKSKYIYLVIYMPVSIGMWILKLRVVTILTVARINNYKCNQRWCNTQGKWYRTMMTSSNGNIFRVTGHLCGEFTGPRWIPHTKASDAELWCLFWSAPE